MLVFLFSMYIMWGGGQGSLFFLMDIQFIETYFLLFTVPLMDKNFFSCWVSLAPLPKIKWPPSGYLFFCVLFHCPVNLRAAITLPWLSQLFRILKSGNVNPPTLLFLFKIAPNIWSLLHFHINIRISLSISRTPAHCILTFDVLHSIPTVLKTRKSEEIALS